ncbi:MAG: alkaline phosphatase family protein [Candidatus Aegiribacteria sp.]|nr:alkaline phosphatase family protein [Candidatus Aegiribacteria sp.]
MRRREFLKLAALSPAALLAGGCMRTSPARRVIVLGIDGMDPFLLRSFINEGVMPNAAILMGSGGLNRLGTSNPPQSPVAWSNFITGYGPDVHGIFDFIHRNPLSREPYLSTSRVTGPDRIISISDWRLPLSGAKVELLRKGEPFWNRLTDEGIPVTMVKLPVDFPPDRGKARILSGLGTPDMRGSQGSFTFFTDDARSITDKTSGGVVVPVRDYGDNCYVCTIKGPENSMRAGNPVMEVEAKVWVDRDADALRIDIQDSRIVLAAGEWSQWVRMRFDAIPHISSVYAIGRFFVKEITPRLKLYLSPLNIDPLNPALPISEPSSFSSDLARDLGPFYTQGFPEDTKALSRGIISDEEYLQQAWIVLQERLDLFHHELSRFRDGMLFFYFSSLDLNIHMFYRVLDHNSPLYASTNPSLKGAIRELYRKIDDVIGDALSARDGNTEIIVLSDHGFAPFNRSFNLNTWLAEEGYANITSPHARNQDMFAAIDWASTAAYGLGLNCLYVNRTDREQNGAVPPEQVADLLLRLKHDLESVTDPATGRKVIANAYITSDFYSGPLPPYAPDMIIGYARCYRSSWETTLGSYPEDVITDNLDPWSGTHCVDPGAVPGILLSTVPLSLPDPNLMDMGKSISSLFGVPVLPPGGRNIFNVSES